MQASLRLLLTTAFQSCVFMRSDPENEQQQKTAVYCLNFKFSLALLWMEVYSQAVYS